MLSEEGAEGLSRDILLVFAEHERLRRSADAFRRAEASAVERGIHLTSRVPTGYMARSRDQEARAERDGAGGHRGFPPPSEGVGLDAPGALVRGAGGSPKTNSSAMTWMVRNRAYLGWAHQHGAVNGSAHSGDRDAAGVDRANAVRGRGREHDGSLSSQLLMLGLVHCETCGWRLSVGSSTRVLDGAKTKVATYTCQNPNCTREGDRPRPRPRPLYGASAVPDAQARRDDGLPGAGTTPPRSSRRDAHWRRPSTTARGSWGTASCDACSRTRSTTPSWSRVAEGVEGGADPPGGLAESGPRGGGARGRHDPLGGVDGRDAPRVAARGRGAGRGRPGRGKRGIPLGERIRVEFRGLDGDPLLEATEADLEDRRRRLRKMGIS